MARTPKLKAGKKPREKLGRPTALTDQVKNTIVQALLHGAYIETAVAHAGVTRESYYEWMRRGSKGDEPFKTFADAITKAIGDAEMWDLAVISKAAQEGNWQASAWRLERKFPRKWGRLDRIEATVNQNVVVEQRRTFALEILKHDAASEAIEVLAAMSAQLKLKASGP